MKEQLEFEANEEEVFQEHMTEDKTEEELEEFFNQFFIPYSDLFKRLA